MWKLYDDLCVGIPSGILIDSCIFGETWTVVRANGNIGIAHSLGSVGEKAEFGLKFYNQPLRDVGNFMHWSDLATASVGMAAISCYYNSSAHAESMNGILDSGQLPVPFSEEFLENKEIALIGDVSFDDFPWSCKVTRFPCPMEPEWNKDDLSAIKNSDVIIVTGDVLTTLALPALLEEVGESATVAICGVGVPCSASFFAFDMPIRVVEGFYPRWIETVEASALLNIQDLSPGLLPFKITPMKIRYLHDSQPVSHFLSSPYKASAFNQRFNSWDGKEYDHETWSDIFKG